MPYTRVLSCTALAAALNRLCFKNERFRRSEIREGKGSGAGVWIVNKHLVLCDSCIFCFNNRDRCLPLRIVAEVSGIEKGLEVVVDLNSELRESRRKRPNFD